MNYCQANGRLAIVNGNNNFCFQRCLLFVIPEVLQKLWKVPKDFNENNAMHKQRCTLRLGEFGGVNVMEFHVLTCYFADFEKQQAEGQTLRPIAKNTYFWRS